MKSHITVNSDLLAVNPLPVLSQETDKDGRGKVVVVGGSKTVPGAPLLAGTAALRAGAGKVMLAVPQSLALNTGLTFPETGVKGFSETTDGNPSEAACAEICTQIEGVQAVLVGPGLMSEETAQRLTVGLLEMVRGPLFVIDALALTGLWDYAALVRQHKDRLVITPHVGEMARLARLTKKQVADAPSEIARSVADRFGCTVVLKGARTYIASSERCTFVHDVNVPGLATAGSGDVLSGLLGGLAARGADTVIASLWSVFLHAQAGEILSSGVGRVGFLARELLDVIPSLIDRYGGNRIQNEGN